MAVGLGAKKDIAIKEEDLMDPYHKISSVFKRDEKTHKFIPGKYSLPEFEYLKDNQWVGTEKVDGTNIRVMLIRGGDFAFSVPSGIFFRGKTDKAQIPTFLEEQLRILFPISKLEEAFPSQSVCLYGEGYGAKIQKGGGNYIPDGVDFILFDVKIDEWWLKREDVEGIAEVLGIKVVPIVGQGTLDDAIKTVAEGSKSTFGDFMAEGLVLKPKVELCTRGGHRIITKLKHKDF